MFTIRVYGSNLKGLNELFNKLFLVQNKGIIFIPFGNTTIRAKNI